MTVLSVLQLYSVEVCRACDSRSVASSELSLRAPRMFNLPGPVQDVI